MGLSLVQGVLQERMTQTSALRNCALVSRYFFDGGRETEIVCVKNVILSHVLLGTCFFGIVK